MAEPIVHLKTCVKCKFSKPTTEFYLDNKQPDRLSRPCKACQRAYRVKSDAACFASPVPAYKRCPYCGMTKQRSEFGYSKRGRGGIACYCKLCAALKSSEFRKIHPETIRYWNRRYREGEDKEQVRARQRRQYHSPTGQELHRRTLLRKYGLTIEDYELTLAAQGYGCAICGAPKGNDKAKMLHIDHNHKTGKTSGLLCNFCNHGLGFFKDDPALLKEAIAYLNWYEKEDENDVA